MEYQKLTKRGRPLLSYFNFFTYNYNKFYATFIMKNVIYNCTYFRILRKSKIDILEISEFSTSISTPQVPLLTHICACPHGEFPMSSWLRNRGETRTLLTNGLLIYAGNILKCAYNSAVVYWLEKRVEKILPFGKKSNDTYVTLSEKRTGCMYGLTVIQKQWAIVWPSGNLKEKFFKKR